MSVEEQSDKECPLCMEQFEVDDIDFYPCKCEYQICRFCWHRIRTNENGLCPACRQPYPENPVNFKPLSVSDLQKYKSLKKQKLQQQKLKLCESRKHLASYRVLQKNLVYVVGLSARVADPEILKKNEYFGKYGKILKVAVGTSPATGPQSASCTAYVTFAKYEDALKAIQAVNNAQLDGRIVKASLGTTKYCSNFLRNQPCRKPDCMYLHDVADNEVSFTKDDMHLGRHAEYERRLIDSLNKSSNSKEVSRRSHSKSNSSERNMHKLNLDDSTKSITTSKETSFPLSVNGQEIYDNPDKLTLKTNNSENLVRYERREKSNRVKFGREEISLESDKKSNLVSDAEVNKHRPAERVLHVSNEISFEKDIENENFVDTKKVIVTGDGDWQPVHINKLKNSHIAEPLHVVTNLENASNALGSATAQKHTRASVQSDDELGFDPFSESAKGLADLIEKEKEWKLKKASPNSCYDGSGNGRLWLNADMHTRLMREKSMPSIHFETRISNIMSEHAYRYNSVENSMNNSEFYDSSVKFTSNGLNGHYQQQQQQQQQQQHQFMHPNISMNYPLPTQPHPPHSFSSPSLTGHFVNGAGVTGYPDPPPGLPSFRYQQQQQMYAQQQKSFQRTHSPMGSTESTQLNEWQENFKALLPNVNVQFTQDMNVQGYNNMGRIPITSASNLYSNHSPIHNGYGQMACTTSFGGNSAAFPTSRQNAFAQTNQPQTHQQWFAPPPGFPRALNR